MLHRFCSSSLKVVDTVVELSPPLSALNVFDEMPATLDKQDSLILQLRDQIPQNPTDCYDVLVPLNPNFSMPSIGESDVDLSFSQFPTDSISLQVYLSNVNNIDLGFTQANRLAVAPLIQFDSSPIITSINNSDVIHEGCHDILLSQSFVLVYSGPKFIISAVSTNQFLFGSSAMVTDGLLSPFCDKVQLTDFGFDPGPYFFNTLYSNRIIIMPNHIGVDLFEFCASNLDHHCHSASKLFVFDYDSDSPDLYTALTSVSIQLDTSNVVFQFQTHLPNSATNTFLPCFVVSHFTRKFSSVLSNFQENLTMETSPIIKDIETLDMALQRATTLVASPRYKSPPSKPMDKIIGHIGRSIDLMLFTSQDVSMNGYENLGALRSNTMTIVQFRVTDPSNKSDFLAVVVKILEVAIDFSCSCVEEILYLKGGYFKRSTFAKFSLHTLVSDNKTTRFWMVTQGLIAFLWNRWSSTNSVLDAFGSNLGFTIFNCLPIVSDLPDVATPQAPKVLDIWLLMLIYMNCESMQKNAKKILRKKIIVGSLHDVVFEFGHLILGPIPVVITHIVHHFDQPPWMFWATNLDAISILLKPHPFVQAAKAIVKANVVYGVLLFQIGDKRLRWKGSTTLTHMMSDSSSISKKFSSQFQIILVSSSPYNATQVVSHKSSDSSVHDFMTPTQCAKSMYSTHVYVSISDLAPTFIELVTFVTFGSSLSVTFTWEYIAGIENVNHELMALVIMKDELEVHTLEPKQMKFACMVILSNRGRMVLEAANLIYKIPGHAELKVLRALLKICGSLGIIVVQNEVVTMMRQSSSQCATHIRPIIATILVCMHVKCDAIAYIYKVYKLLQHNNILAWNNTLPGVGLHGNDTDAPFDVYGILKWGSLLYFPKAIQLCEAALVAISFGQLLEARVYQPLLTCASFLDPDVTSFKALYGQTTNHKLFHSRLFLQCQIACPQVGTR